MNWLAHVFLSETNIDFQLGNYLADILKGKSFKNANSDFNKGLQTHKLIDSFTDSHEFFSLSKNRIRKKGLLRSVVIDITYDYLLTKNWNNYSNIEFNSFLEKFYKDANTRIDNLPEPAKSFTKRAIKFKTLNSYQSINDLELAFNRIDTRLSLRLLKRDTTSSYYKDVVKNIDQIENDFNLFFPLLIKKVKEHLNTQRISHIK